MELSATFAGTFKIVPADVQQVEVVGNITPIQHARKVISSVAQQSDRAILFYSGGKDSLVLLDLMAPHFKEILCVFMYFVKDMRHIQPYLDHIGNYPNARLIQVPHFMLNAIFRVGRYCVPNPKIKAKTLKHLDKAIRAKENIDWSFCGWKKADNMVRLLALRRYEDEAVCIESQKAYPLSIWNKADVLAYIRHKQLPQPVDYGQTKASAGLMFDPDVFAWLRVHYPDDLEKIYQVFPMSRQILYEYDRRKQAEQIPEI